MESSRGWRLHLALGDRFAANFQQGSRPIVLSESQLADSKKTISSLLKRESSTPSDPEEASKMSKFRSGLSNFQADIRRLIGTTLKRFDRENPQHTQHLDEYIRQGEWMILSADISQSTFNFEPACMVIEIVFTLYHKVPRAMRKSDIVSIIAHGNHHYNRIIDNGGLEEGSELETLDAGIIGNVVSSKN